MRHTRCLNQQTQNDCHLSFVCHSCDDSSIGWDCVPRRAFPFKFSHKTFHFWLKCSVFSVQKHIYMSKHLQENAINQMVFERNFGNGGEIFIFKKLIACFVLRNNIGKVFVFFLPARFIIKKVIPVVLQKNWKHVFPTFPHCLTVAFRIIIFLTYNTRNFFFVWEFFF